MPAWLIALPDGVEIAVLAQPRSSRSRVVGEHGGMLKIQLASPPVEGAANAELLDLLAKTLGVPRRALTLVAGEGSRRKRVRVEGVEPTAVIAAMDVSA